MWDYGNFGGRVMAMGAQTLRITIEGEGVRAGIPLPLLATVFRGIQETVYYIAMAETGRDWRKRVRVPDDVREEYQLVRIAEYNSVYTVDIAFAAPFQRRFAFEPDGRSVVLDKYTTLLGFLSKGEAEKISTLFPDTVWRRKILRSVEAHCPRSGDQWYLTVAQEATGLMVRLSAMTRTQIGGLLAAPELDDLTVSGELVRIHLDEHKIGIYYEPTKRILDCYYDPDLEDLIVGSLKGIVHVTGRVELDANGFPAKIVDVTDIRPLDLSPLSLKVIETAEGRLVLREPMVLSPSFEEQEVVFQVPELNIVASGPTREDAVEELCADMTWLWKEYAQESDEELSGDANELAKRLRAMVREASVENGRLPP